MKKNIFAIYAFVFCVSVILCLSSLNCSNKSALSSNDILPTTLASSETWDGTLLPAYPKDGPKITMVKYTVPAHSRLDKNLQNNINCGFVTKGEITVVGDNGMEHTFRSGEAVIEMCGTTHYGENRSDTDTELLMVYVESENLPMKN